MVWKCSICGCRYEDARTNDHCVAWDVNENPCGGLLQIDRSPVPSVPQFTDAEIQAEIDYLMTPVFRTGTKERTAAMLTALLTARKERDALVENATAASLRHAHAMDELHDGHLRIDECFTQDGKGQPIRERISLVIDRLCRRAEEAELTMKAVGAEMDSLRAQVTVAQCRQGAAERRAMRIEPSKAETQLVEARAALRQLSEAVRGYAGDLESTFDIDGQRHFARDSTPEAQELYVAQRLAAEVLGPVGGRRGDDD